MEDGTVKGVGDNRSGQLGIGNTNNQNRIVNIPISGVKLLFNEVLSFLIIITENMEKILPFLNINNIPLLFSIDSASEDLQKLEIFINANEEPIISENVDFSVFPLQIKRDIEQSFLNNGINEITIRVSSINNNQGKISFHIFKSTDFAVLFDKLVITKDIDKKSNEVLVSTKINNGKYLLFLLDGVNWMNITEGEFNILPQLEGDEERIKLAFVMDKDAELKAYGIGWK
jgi:hypothetical protein